MVTDAKIFIVIRANITEMHIGELLSAVGGPFLRGKLVKSFK